MTIGLFFGSFNPIHIGHLAIANYMLEYSALEQLWFVISPHNPLKKKRSLLDKYQRYELVMRAIGDHLQYRASNIEFNLPQPSYTIDTLVYLQEKYPQHRFALIMGADNLTSLHKWKNYEVLLADYPIYVYPRPGVDSAIFGKYPEVSIVDAPQMDISSTFIRKARKEKRNIPFFMPKAAYEYMTEMHFYE